MDTVTDPARRMTAARWRSMNPGDRTYWLALDSTVNDIRALIADLTAAGDDPEDELSDAYDLVAALDAMTNGPRE